LAMPHGGLRKTTIQLLHFSLAAHKPREATSECCLEACSRGATSRQLVDGDRIGESLH
jgi:hypothetical protein